MGIVYGGAKRIGESGTITLSDSIDGGIVETVNFSTYYRNPVVFTFISTNNDANAVEARVKNVTRNSCEIFMERPEATSHGSETICYLVMEEGVHQLDDDGFVEVGSVNSNAGYRASVTGNGQNTKETINLSHNFSSFGVIHSLNTRNNGEFMSTLTPSKDSNTFTIQQMALETNSTFAEEKIAWMAFTTGNYYNYEASEFSVGAYNISFSNSYSTPPDVIVKGNSLVGIDGYFIRGTGVSTSGVNVFAQEDQIYDAETGHASESGSYIAVKSGTIFYERYKLNRILNQ